MIIIGGRAVDLRIASRVAFAAVFVAAGLAHFIAVDFYAEKLPSFVPQRRSLVLAAGVMEIALAALSLRAASRRPACLVLMLFLCCVIPINVVHNLQASGGPPSLLLWLRLPLLAGLATWAYVNARL